MAIRGNSITVQYVAWNTSSNAGQTGDSANHTLRCVKDGTSAAPTNSPSEVNATNAPGVYSLVLTATEMTCDCITVCGKSSTANVVIIPLTVTTEHGVLPNVQQGNAGAVLTSGTGTAQLSVTGGVASANAVQVNAVSTSSVTAVNASLGTTSTVLFDGSGYVKANAEAVSDKTGYSLTQTFPANFSALAISASGVVSANLQQWLGSAPNALVSGKVDSLASLRTGTAQGGGSNTITLDAGASATDQYYRGLAVLILSGTGAGQCRLIVTYTGSTQVAQVARTWTVQPDATSVFALIPWSQVDVWAWIGGTVASTVAGYPDVNTRYWGGTAVGALPANFSSLAISSGGAVTVGGYAASEDPATLVLGATASSWNGAGTIGAKINSAGGAADPLTNAVPGSYASGTAGYVLGHNLDTNVGSRSAPATAQTIDLTSAVPTSNTAQTIGDALNAARAQGFGRWVLSGTTLTLYAADGTTVVRTFTLDSATAPTTRT